MKDDTITVVGIYRITSDTSAEVVVSIDDPIGVVQEKVVKYQLQTAEKGISEALIALGWTPPND